MIGALQVVFRERLSWALLFKYWASFGFCRVAG